MWESEDVSRRTFLQALITALTTATLPFSWTEMASAANGVFLSTAEAADVEAVAAQIIPTDDTPGAREAGVIHFIDRALATVLGHLAGEYRSHLGEFQAVCRERHPGVASFAALGSDEQIAYLRTVEQTPFFQATHLLTVLGMFTMPSYGGNRDGIGWKLIGLEDAHAFQPPFGYYDRDYQGDVAGPVTSK